MYGLLQAKGITWIPPARHILVLVNRFDREFVMTLQRHGSISGKNGGRFDINFVFNEVSSLVSACVSINEFLREI